MVKWFDRIDTLLPDFWEFVSETPAFGILDMDNTLTFDYVADSPDDDGIITRKYTFEIEITAPACYYAEGVFVLDTVGKVVLSHTFRVIEGNRPMYFNGIMRTFFKNYRHNPRLPSLFNLTRFHIENPEFDYYDYNKLYWCEFGPQ